MQKLIGIYSSAPQSGKTTAARYLLARYGYQTVPFAQTLKDMVVPMLVALGYTQTQAHHLVTENKEFVLPIGVTVRHVLRTLGTEWGRDCIHPNVWLECWKTRIYGIDLVTVDDVRFVNEAELVKALGGTMVRIDRPGALVDHQHSSEGGLDDYEKFDYVIENSGSLQDFYTKLSKVVH
jgi:hypothetical protein